jgi:signal transduction histidine kinase
LLGALRRAVEGELAGSFDHVTWSIDPEAEPAAREMPSLQAEVLFGAAREAARNAALHARDGQEPLHVVIDAHVRDGRFELEVADDGVGLAPAGASGGPADGAEPQRSGQGLVLHSTMMAIIGGTLDLTSSPGHGTRVSLTIPLEIS